VTQDPELPEALKDLDASLLGVRFQPRASLLPEVLGRLRREEPLKGVAPLHRSRLALRAIAAALVAAVGVAIWVGQRSHGITMDHCCYDLDGGGSFDDGVLVVTRGGEAVRRIAVYEDRDGSRSLTSGDVVRFERGSTLTVGDTAAEGLVTTRHCCLDYDGGGPADDGLLVMGVPPDRVMMVALYEVRPRQPSPHYPLR
jgi:hypothetical protein